MQETISTPKWRSSARLPLGRIALMFIAVCIVAGVAAAAYLLTTGGSSSDDTVVVTSVAIEPPAGWAVTPLTAADQGAGLILKLDNEGDQASFLGRMVIARVGQDFNIGQLGIDTEAALVRDIEGVTIASNDVVRVGDFDAVKVTFRQTVDAATGGGTDTFRTSMFIVPMENQTFYLTMRAPVDNFTSLEADGDQIVQRILAAISALD